MAVPELEPLDNTELIRRWILPYFSRGLVYKWSPSLWLEEARRNGVKHLVPRFLLRDLQDNAYDFELPEFEDVKFLDSLRGRYKSDFFFASIFGRKTLLLFDYKTIGQVLNESPAWFGPGSSKARAANYFQPDGVIVSTGDSWKERRRRNEDALQHRKSGQLHHQHGLAQQFLSIVEEEFEEAIEKQGGYDALALNWQFIASVSERITLRVVFGHDVNEKGKLDRLLELSDHHAELMRQANLAPIISKLNRYHPELGPLVHAIRNPHFDEMFKGIREHLDNPAAGSLIDLFAGAQDDKPDWLQRQIPQWLFAMREGIGLHCLATLRMLASHPDMLERVMKELLASDYPLNPDALGTLEALENCVRETMRLWTAVPFLSRVSHHRRAVATKSGAALTIEPNTQILILNAYSNRNPDATSDPHQFDPDRWVNTAHDPIPHLSNHFGAGPQRCAGAGLAVLLVKAMTATLLRKHHPAGPIDALAYKRKDDELVACPLHNKDDKCVPFSFDHFRIDRREPMATVKSPGPLEELPTGTSSHPNEERYDFIVVGSGAGGGPLAVNLARHGWKVLLLEAGGDPCDETVRERKYRIPAFHPLASEEKELSWNFFVDRAGNRSRFYPRGCALGGSTAVHALITVKAPDKDWDDMAAALDDPTWNAVSMNGILKDVLRREYAGESGGWLNVELPNTLDLVGTLLADPPLKDILLTAARRMTDRTSSDLVKYAEVSLSQLLALVRDVSPSAKRALARFGALAPPSRLAPLLMLLRLLERDINEPDCDWLSEDGLFLLPMSTRNRARAGSRERIVRFHKANRDGSENLVVKTEALVTGIDLEDEGPRANGVSYLEGGHPYKARGAGKNDPEPIGRKRGELEKVNRDKLRHATARKEVILCAGAFNSPQILMLSGIGPERELRKHGIPVRVDLPGVGRNLQDRYEYTVVSEFRSKPGETKANAATFNVLHGASFAPEKKAFKDEFVFRQWFGAGRGLYATNGIGLGLVLRSKQATDENPDLFLFGAPTEFTGYYQGYSKKLTTEKSKFTWAILKARTGNRGTVQLRCADPTIPPIIEFNNFARSRVRVDEKGPLTENEQTEKDLAALVEGVEFVRDIMANEKVRQHGLREHHPHLETWEPKKVPLTDENLAAERKKIAREIEENAWGHHACGTCKMGDQGKDKYAVVDSQFRVHGVSGLRVVDASIFPRIPGFFIALPVYMVSEKASRLIHEEALAKERAEAEASITQEDLVLVEH